ncbi:peptidase M3A and M3B thimet/oligopeptidase F [Bacillus sp. 31A1R]|uniref:Peptidase M3A and M3B thimet/oligopeptidase F n=1 Tax=Robertmurraya mangrovi TaxID=3098077 RepID=A0ABU5J0I0_9BACI|nr:peptidase M3A and M3B thimet/oligopeptidase F [Bacillus sp. 31A1R]MDZ5472923.1 peptidase M3A and M3B thimet/oligopeptidase F [Bacillus sp. 31A1R]
MSSHLEAFLEKQNEQLETLYKRVAFNHWMSATTGKEEWAEKNKHSLKEYYSYFANKERFQMVKSFRSEDTISVVQRRQLDDLYNKMIKNQRDQSSLDETLELEKELSVAFNTYRPTVDGMEITNNDILKVLKESKSESERKQAWLASKQIVKKLEERILKLVRKRNQDARSLGFSNYYEMNFITQDLDIDVVFKVFNDLKKISDFEFRKIKNEIDTEITEKLNIKIEDIRPWHYTDPFFQEAPPLKGIDVDCFYKDKDLEKVSRATFDSMGLNVDDILNQSDLYARKDKNPFGFCSDLDRSGDIRILINLENNQFWGTALLHELGHAVYSKYINRTLPFILRFQSHTLTTEASALFFGRLTKSSAWLKKFMEVDDEKVIFSMEKALRRDMIVSARWFLTFSYFEKALYENPDQDLNQLWWTTVKEIQLLNPPEDCTYPDWASKMHFSLAPVSYQNYLLGELAASQLQGYIENHISVDLFKPEVGQYLIENYFQYGAVYDWNEKIKQATGENLNPAYFVKQFLKCKGDLSKKRYI